MSYEKPPAAVDVAAWPDAVHPASVDEEEAILPSLMHAFAPLHKSAFGVACGVAGAVLIAALTIARLLLPSAQAFPLYLLHEYFAGYSLSWTGVIVGALWAFAVAFVAGWFAAFCRNLVLAVAAFIVRTRAELAETRDFLDHI
jgi:hypothetical protein